MSDNSKGANKCYFLPEEILPKSWRNRELPNNVRCGPYFIWEGVVQPLLAYQKDVKMMMMMIGLPMLSHTG